MTSPCCKLIVLLGLSCCATQSAQADDEKSNIAATIVEVNGRVPVSESCPNGVLKLMFTNKGSESAHLHFCWRSQLRWLRCFETEGS